jgi:hypothetical protein
MAALCVCEGLCLAQPLLRVKESYTAAAGFTNSAAHLSFGRLVGLGTSGWRGALSAEGVKSGVQLPPKEAPLAPVGPFLSLETLILLGLELCDYGCPYITVAKREESSSTEMHQTTVLQGSPRIAFNLCALQEYSRLRAFTRLSSNP